MKKGKRKKKTVMKILRHFIFTFVAVIGLTMAVSAQKNDQKKPPPKEGRPPVVTPKDKKPPKDNPRGDRKKPKKPGMSWLFASSDREEVQG